ncbi:MAG: mhpB 1 [Rhodospirillales bacterium]|nr:mhpB 1 [Rhodospirillales bacterium]
MPVVLGLASSHTPSMFVSADKWPMVHQALVRDVPQPKELAQETPEVLEDYVRRVNQGFATLQAELEAAKPDAVFIIGDDQNELFSNAMIPSFAIFIGEEAEGSYAIGFAGEKPAEKRITLTCNPVVAKVALNGLMERGFDFGFAEKLVPLARPEIGLGHAFTRIGRAMHLSENGIPAVPIFTNAYHPPLPSAARCYALGQALRDIFANRSERIALYGSGGLSHDPRGPRAGWVDEPLDRWVLERIERGEGGELKNLFTTDSATLRSGTGEIRNWIAVAGAYDGAKGTVVDYIPARHAVTGLGFAYWKDAA